MINLTDNFDLMSDPETRAAIEAARAENKALRRQALEREIKRHESRLLPGAVARIAESHPELGHGGVAATIALQVFEFMTSPAGDRYLKPEHAAPRGGPVVVFDADGNPHAPPPATRPETSRGDSLRVALDLFADAFGRGEAEKLYNESALEYSNGDPGHAVEFVARFVGDRRNNARLSTNAKVPPSAQTLRIVEALRPLGPQLRKGLLEVAEAEFADLASPASPRFNDRELAKLVESRVEHFSSEALVHGTFDPTRVVRPRPVQQQQTPAATNAAQFDRMW